MKDRFDRAVDGLGETVYEVLVKFQREHPEKKEELEKKVNPPPKSEENLSSDRWA